MAPQENRSATIIPAYRMSSAVNLFFPLIVLIPFVASFATSIELLDARREPEPVARIADQQHGCGAGGRRRWRRQHAVDLEVPVRAERNPDLKIDDLLPPPPPPPSSHLRTAPS